VAVKKNCKTDSPYVRDVRVIVRTYTIPVLVVFWIAVELAHWWEWKRTANGGRTGLCSDRKRTAGCGKMGSTRGVARVWEDGWDTRAASVARTFDEKDETR